MGDLAADARRAGYKSGVIAATAAFMSDLEALGALDNAEVLERGEDGVAEVCFGCQMRRLGYSGLADRFEFAVGVTGG